MVLGICALFSFRPPRTLLGLVWVLEAHLHSLYTVCARVPQDRLRICSSFPDWVAASVHLVVVCKVFPAVAGALGGCLHSINGREWPKGSFAGRSGSALARILSR